MIAERIKRKAYVLCNRVVALCGGVVVRTDVAEEPVTL
jgi:hypothetical protein